MGLDNQILALIAVGASVTANCQPCLESTVAMALGQGADNAQITEAIQVGKRVRQGAASKLDKFALSLNDTVLAATQAEAGPCGCDSQDGRS